MADNEIDFEETEESQDAEDPTDGLEELIDESSEMTASEDETSWISWFISIRGNDFFCEVEESFVQDDFNLTGLSTQVPYYDYALDMILDVDIPLDKLSEEQHEIVETAAEVLYGLIHARYILTTAGMNRMYDKYQNVDFGRCPRSLCQGQAVLPVGLSDITREFSVEVFCPRCHETYHPRSSKHANLDGAYFGTTFCHLLLVTHPELIETKPTDTYVPRIFGFRINESSAYYKLRDANQSKRKAGNSKSSNSTITPTGPNATPTTTDNGKTMGNGTKSGSSAAAASNTSAGGKPTTSVAAGATSSAAVA